MGVYHLTPCGILWYDKRMGQKRIHLRMYVGRDDDVIGAIAEQVATGVTQNRAAINLMRSGINPAHATPTLTAAQVRAILRDELSNVAFTQATETQKKAPDEDAAQALKAFGASMIFDYEGNTNDSDND